MLLSAAAVAVAVIAAAMVSYAVVRNELRDQVDRQLRDQAQLAVHLPPDAFVNRTQPLDRTNIPDLPPRRGGPAGYAQLVAPDGTGFARSPGEALPVSRAVEQVAAGTRDQVLTDITVGGEHLRMLAEPIAGGGAVQLARSLESADSVLRRLARSIELTGDLARRIRTPGSDEVGRLAARFNAMLDRLSSSLAAQRASTRCWRTRWPARAATIRASTTASNAEPTNLEGRPDRLGRAVNNLLDNAAKHGGDGPVDVTLRDGLLVVRDHGPGVPEPDRDLIFDRFHRGEAARAGSGSGLGLAIVRQVAEAHGGSVALRVPADGGAAFELRLPADDRVVT